jgi:DNA-binding response OmpR family regulator
MKSHRSNRVIKNKGTPYRKYPDVVLFTQAKKNQGMSRERQTAPQATSPLIHIIGADRATYDLLSEWLTSAGFAVANAGGTDPAVSGPAVLAIIDVPFTRHGGHELVQRVAAQYPGVRMLALSPTLFSNVRCGGNCARALGVDGVLPKPIAREAMIATVRNLLQPKE